MNFLNQRKKLLLPISFILLLLIILVAFNFSKPGQPVSKISSPAPSSRTSIGTTPNPNPDTKISIQPKQGTLLKPGENETFTISFPQQIATETAKISLTSTEAIRDIKISPSFNSNWLNSKTLIISLLEVIKPLTRYDILLESPEIPQQKITFSYSSDQEVKPVSSNNQDLVQYLPLETDNFLVRYLPEQNIYIFNLKPDYNSPQSVEDQFTKAQNDALSLIKAYGINPKTLIIEWKYY